MLKSTGFKFGCQTSVICLYLGSEGITRSVEDSGLDLFPLIQGVQEFSVPAWGFYVCKLVSVR